MRSMEKHDTSRRAGEADRRSCKTARQAVKRDAGAIIEVVLNIAVVLVLVITVSV